MLWKFPEHLFYLHAKVPGHLERDDARPSPVQADGHSLRWTGFLFNGGFYS